MQPRPHRRARALAAILATTTASVGFVAFGPVAAHAATVADDVVVRSADATGVVAVDVLANDDDATSIVSVSQPAIGSVAIVGATVELAYPSTFAGEASFTYTAADADGGTADATVRVTIENDAPVAADDAAATATDPVRIAVLANDADANGDALTITTVDVAVEQGEAWIEDAGTATPTDDVVVYAPAATFAGDAAIAYEIVDSRGATAAASIVVSVLGADPVLADDVVTTAQGRAVIVDALANDVDPLGRILSYDSWGLAEATDGELVLDDAGTPEDASDDVLVFTPAQYFLGSADFRYVVATPQGARFVGFGRIDVISPYPVLLEDHVTTPYGVPVTVDPLANDVDPFGETLTVVSAGVDETQGTAAVVDGLVRFTPREGFTGRSLVTYHVVSAQGYPAAQVVAVTVEAPLVAAPEHGSAAGPNAGTQQRLPATGSAPTWALAPAAALLLLLGLAAWVRPRRRGV